MTGKDNQQYKHLGFLLARRREALGRTQTDVASRVGIASSNFISMIEKGKGKIPMDKARLFAAAYGMREPLFLEILIRVAYPDFWDAFRLIRTGHPRDGVHSDADLDDLLAMIPPPQEPLG